MEPVTFPEVNRTLVRPAAMAETECGSLPVYADGHQTISCWRLTWGDRLRLLRTGRLWLGVLGGVTQPPVWMSSVVPFVRTPSERRKAEREDQRSVSLGAVLFVLGGLLFALLVASRAHAQTPAIAPSPVPLIEENVRPVTEVLVPVPEPKPSPGMNEYPDSVSVTVAAITTMTGDVDTKVTPEGFVETDIGLGIGRVKARMGITSQPGATVDLSQPTSFYGAEFGVGLARVLFQWGDSRMAVQAEGGGTTRLPQTPAALDRVAKYWGVGAAFSHKTIGQLTLLVGQDESVGDSAIATQPDGTQIQYRVGRGTQLMAYGYVNVPTTSGIVQIVGDATINLGTVDPLQVGTNPPRRDIVRLGVAVDLATAMAKLRNGNAATPPQ